ncbi:hypothetical protein R1sor_007361 [Riccia sorocarpa]|uniref:RRM domain-containing protein n=1 Tax=Riccia sorocarpa TaxID=122646 RepID=A0ABD3HUF3_9MARC
MDDSEAETSLANEEERIRLMLEELFGPPAEDITSEDTADEERFRTEEWPSVLSLQPEELYGHLESEGLLRPPLTLAEFIDSDASSSDLDYRIWGSWKTTQVQLVRDTDCAERIKYKTSVSRIGEEFQTATGLSEVFVSRIWDGVKIPPLVGFGTLLEGFDGAYRAGIDIGGVNNTPQEAVVEGQGSVLLASSELLVDMRTELTQAVTVTTELRTDIKKLQTQLADQAADLKLQARAMTEVQSGIGKVGKSVMLVHSDILKLQQHLDDQSGTVDVQSTTLTSAKNDLESIRTLIGGLQVQIGTIQSTEELAAGKVLSDVLPQIEQHQADIETKLHKQVEALSSNLMMQVSEMRHDQTEENKRHEALLKHIKSGTEKASLLSPPDYGQLLVDLETRMRTHVEVSRQTHADFLQEQDREHSAREARCRNIRVVGLNKQEGEDTRECVTQFFRDVLRVADPVIDQVTRIGRSDKGARAVLVRFSSVAEKNRVLGNRSMLKGHRIWLDHDLTPKQMEEKKKELAKIKEASDEGWVAFLRDGQAVIFGGSKLWEHVDILALVETWESLDNMGKVIPGFERVETVGNLRKTLRGRGFGGIGIWARSGLDISTVPEFIDPNKHRIGSSQPAARDEGPHEERSNRSSVAVWNRVSEDNTRNSFADPFLRFICAGGLTILNGSARFPNTGTFTCKTANGASVVDFLMACTEGRERVSDLSCGAFQPESDHTPICFTLNGFLMSTRRKKSSRKIVFDRLLRKDFEQALAVQLQNVQPNPNTVADLLRSTAKLIFSKVQGRNNSWFDNSCVLARTQLLNSNPSESEGRSRAYKQLIRAKKRWFRREQKRILERELELDPQSF